MKINVSAATTSMMIRPGVRNAWERGARGGSVVMLPGCERNGTPARRERRAGEARQGASGHLREPQE
ncbi:hypothetical protein GCM10022227_50680 [Streptomyces sedi]